MGEPLSEEGVSKGAASLVPLYQDEHFIAFSKPSGLLVHRGWGDDPVTATDLARQFASAPVSPAHRIDRATSGVLLFAHTAHVASLLQSGFEAGTIFKTYIALVRGIAPEQGVIDHPIPRREDGPRVAALTHVALLHNVSTGAPLSLPVDIRRSSLVLARPKTGRLHQVRRHLKHIHHPLIGDANYGKGPLNRLFAETIGLRRLALHALSLRLTHPITSEPLFIKAPLPLDLTEPFERIGIPPQTWELEEG